MKKMLLVLALGASSLMAYNNTNKRPVLNVSQSNTSSTPRNRQTNGKSYGFTFGSDTSDHRTYTTRSSDRAKVQKGESGNWFDQGDDKSSHNDNKQWSRPSKGTKEYAIPFGIEGNGYDKRIGTVMVLAKEKGKALFTFRGSNGEPFESTLEARQVFYTNQSLTSSTKGKTQMSAGRDLSKSHQRKSKGGY